MKRRELDPHVENELVYLPAIPIPLPVELPSAKQSNEYDFLEDSVFKPLKTSAQNVPKSIKQTSAIVQRKNKGNMKKRRRIQSRV